MKTEHEKNAFTQKKAKGIDNANWVPLEIIVTYSFCEGEAPRPNKKISKHRSTAPNHKTSKKLKIRLKHDQTKTFLFSYTTCSVVFLGSVILFFVSFKKLRQT